MKKIAGMERDDPFDCFIMSHHGLQDHLKERNHHQGVNRKKCWACHMPHSFELAGKGFFFFFVAVKKGFDMFGNVLHIMLENTFA